MNRARMWKRISIISFLAICVIVAIVFIVTQCNDKSAIEGVEETEEETISIRKVRDLLNLPPEIESLTVGPIPEGFPHIFSENINGIPVIEETEYKAEEKYNWKILPKDEKETGIIESFSVDDRHRCAILVNDKIMVYDETSCIFKCQFKAPESCLVLLWNGNLVLYSVSDELFFKVDLETSELREYRLDDTYIKGHEVSEWLKLKPGNPDTENGFYLTNHLGNQEEYDMLVYVKDGKPQTVYSSYTNTKVVCWIVAAVVVSIVAALILLRFYRKKKKQKQNEGQNRE